MSVSHARNICKSQNTLMPVFFCFWPSSMIISLRVQNLAQIRTITDHCQNSSVCPPQKYSVCDYFVTYRHIFYFVTYIPILYSILWLTDTFSIFWLTDTFRKLEIWCNLQFLRIISLCTVGPVWAEYMPKTNLEKLWIFCDLHTSYVRVTRDAYFS